MKIDKKLIKELTDYLDEFNLTELEYSNKDIQIKVSKSRKVSTPIQNVQTNKIKDENMSSKVSSGSQVKSPIIGTAYLAPEPGGKKFAEKGRKIKKGDTIMIVEAMKTMNHVPCPMDGTIKEICVEDGQPVEFGQTIAILD